MWLRTLSQDLKTWQPLSTARGQRGDAGCGTDFGHKVKLTRMPWLLGHIKAVIWQLVKHLVLPGDGRRLPGLLRSTM
jgi:hypothetical protein